MYIDRYKTSISDIPAGCGDDFHARALLSPPESIHQSLMRELSLKNIDVLGENNSLEVRECDVVTEKALLLFALAALPKPENQRHLNKQWY